VLEPAADQRPRLRLILGQQVLRDADQVHIAAEAAEGLCQLACQRTASDDDQSCRQLGQREDGFVGQVVAGLQPVDGGTTGSDPVAITAFRNRNCRPSTSTTFGAVKRVCPR
jgi:hypothetical protein